MKRILLILSCVLVWCRAGAQRQEIEQLLLNVTKLEQFRQILSDMKKGYDILVRGYGVVRDVSEGNFSLHKTFLDALFEVSPGVRKYKKISQIIEMQARLVQRYRKAYAGFRASGQFDPGELLYLGRVYGRLTDQSLKNLESLLDVVTAGKLRMSDEERLAAIDVLHAEVSDQLGFLNDFNNRTALLAVQRQRESGEIKTVQGLHHK